MKRLVLIGTLLFVAACGSSPSNPSSNPTAPTFTATLLPANENPPIGNAESTGTGSVTVILNLTRDANQNITAATASFQVSLAGFPTNTPRQRRAHPRGGRHVQLPGSYQSGARQRRGRVGERCNTVHQEQRRELRRLDRAGDAQQPGRLLLQRPLDAEPRRLRARKAGQGSVALRRRYALSRPRDRGPEVNSARGPR